MKMTVIALASAMACAGIAFAAGADDITAAAQDPSKIPEIVKALQGQKGSEFAADVISAIAAMPGNPSKKVKKMVAASEAFLGSVPDGELASLLANLTANVPFASLPAWVDGFKGAVDALTKDLSDAVYNKLVNDVMSKINKLSDTSDADKTVISTFALKLLARGSTIEEKTEWLNNISLPASYGKQVKDAAPGVFAGNYDAVLGPDIAVVKAGDGRIVTPGDDAAFVEESTLTKTTPIGTPVIQSTEGGEGLERPEPLGTGTGTGTGTGKVPSKPSKPKPPVAEKYEGQK